MTKPKYNMCINPVAKLDVTADKKLKQQYIYVARDLVAEHTKLNYICSIEKMELKSVGTFLAARHKFHLSKKPFYGIKLKKGEQKRIPILIEKAEVVK